MRDSSSGVAYLYGDHLGSASVAVGANGALLSRTRYKPWGEQRGQSGATFPTDRLFTGQIWDGDTSSGGTGLYFYNARYYDPALGRFTQADTIVPEPGTPMAFDRYAYTLNNPVRYSDPTGHDVMLVGGWNTNDWENPILWKEWIMAYKDWSEDEWDTYYNDWRNASDGVKTQIMVSTGVYIFRWGGQGVAQTNAQSRATTIEVGMQRLKAQLLGLQDVTIIGHSKGGNLILNYLSDERYSGWNIKNAIVIDTPTRKHNIFRIGSKSRTVANTIEDSGASLVNIYNGFDPVNSGPHGYIDGAINHLDWSEAPLSALWVHSIKGHWAKAVLTNDLNITGDHHARSGYYEWGRR